MSSESPPDLPDGVYEVHPDLAPLVVPIDKLVPDPHNARAHTEKNVQAIMYSLSEYGQQKPISLTPGGVTVLAGNATLEAAKNLGWTHIAAIEFNHDESLKQWGWRIADNRTAELAHWDVEKLDLSLTALGEEMDLKLLGFDADDLQHLSGDWSGDTQDRDDIPDYDPNKETYVVKIEGIRAAHKDDIVRRVSRALDGTEYECKAY